MKIYFSVREFFSGFRIGPFPSHAFCIYSLFLPLARAKKNKAAAFKAKGEEKWRNSGVITCRHPVR